MNLTRESLLLKILDQPTAPFREAHVIREVLAALKEHKVPHFLDPVGNIVVGAKSKAEYQKIARTRSKEPLRVFIAHTDHPGFHGVKWNSPTELAVKWHGGTPVAHLESAPVWIADSGEHRAEGTLHDSVLLKHGKSLDTSVVRFANAQDTRKKPETLFGAFRFRSTAWKNGELLYTKAADDLIGVFAILSMAFDRKPSQAPFFAILTRAEEVGFIGAIGHFELGWLKGAKRPVFCVSLETSRTLPGADIGKGPVVRLGDRMTVFTPGHLKVFTDLAQKVLPDKFQRRIMDGGACEASAATAYGFSTVGISVPLGNYHNQSFQGGPDSRGELGPAPEFVHMSDIQGMITLCRALLTPKLKWDNPWADRVAGFKKSYKGYAKLLNSR